jgi:hypothetical protein
MVMVMVALAFAIITTGLLKVLGRIFVMVLLCHSSVLVAFC